MADKTKIEWADATLNYLNGCSVLSPGCTNCYAMRLAGTRLKHHPSRAGLTQDSKAGPVWTGEVRAHEPAMLQALAWKAPRRIFWNAHGDLFHENVSDAAIDRLFAACALTPQHTHMILTKRSARMREYVGRAGVMGNSHAYPGHAILAAMDGLSRAKWPNLRWPLPNVWLGVSVEDQQRANERVPDLLSTPAAVRFLSCEPLLGPVDLTAIATMRWRGAERLNALRGTLRGMFGDYCPTELPALDWIIAGGESGPGARPMHLAWARSLRDQCAAAGVAFHFKQWGEWGPDNGPDADFDRHGYQRDRVMEGAGPCAAWRDGAWQFAPNGYAMPLSEGADTQWLYRLGKKRNGRLLDGRTHDEFPA